MKADVGVCRDESLDQLAKVEQKWNDVKTDYADRYVNKFTLLDDNMKLCHYISSL